MQFLKRNTRYESLISGSTIVIRDHLSPLHIISMLFIETAMIFYATKGTYDSRVSPSKYYQHTGTRFSVTSARIKCFAHEPVYGAFVSLRLRKRTFRCASEVSENCWDLWRRVIFYLCLAKQGWRLILDLALSG